jgi:hypothetical protein
MREITEKQAAHYGALTGRIGEAISLLLAARTHLVSIGEQDLVDGIDRFLAESTNGEWQPPAGDT